MHGDLMLLYLLSLWIMTNFHEEVAKSWAKFLSITLPSSFRGHPGLAKYIVCNIQLFSIRRLLTGLCHPCR